MLRISLDIETYRPKTEDLPLKNVLKVVRENLNNKAPEIDENCELVAEYYEKCTYKHIEGEHLKLN